MHAQSRYSSSRNTPFSATSHGGLFTSARPRLDSRWTPNRGFGSHRNEHQISDQVSPFTYYTTPGNMYVRNTYIAIPDSTPLFILSYHTYVWYRIPGMITSKNNYFDKQKRQTTYCCWVRVFGEPQIAGGVFYDTPTKESKGRSI